MEGLVSQLSLIASWQRVLDMDNLAIDLFFPSKLLQLIITHIPLMI